MRIDLQLDGFVIGNRFYSAQSASIAYRPVKAITLHGTLIAYNDLIGWFYRVYCLLSDKANGLRIMDVMLNAICIEYKHSLMIIIDKINQTLTGYYAGMSRFAGIEFALMNWSCNDRMTGQLKDVFRIHLMHMEENPQGC